MPWSIGDILIQTVAIIDDEPDARETLSWVIRDSDLSAIDMRGPIGQVEEAVGRVGSLANAVVCDHYLNHRNYASFLGSQFVSLSVQEGLPSILCTRYLASDVDTIRPYLEHIPSLRRPDELVEPEELHAALEECVAEIRGDIREERRPWRTQIVVDRVDELDPDILHVEIPAWPIDETIRLRRQFLRGDVAGTLKAGFRCHAYVNLGAEASDLVFFTRWELPS